MAGTPNMPEAVAAVVGSYPPPARDRLLAIRALIFEVAAAEWVGPLTETLKWGQPAYLTEATKAGTTVRLGWSEKAPGDVSVFVHCQTTLADRLRARFGQDLRIEGNRAIHLALDAPLPEGPLAGAIALALTYHRAKKEAAAHG